MPIGTMHMMSRGLGRPTPYTVILPEPDLGPGPYPVLLQLHGKWDDYQSWLVKSRLASHVEPLPLIVVLPDGGNFWWSNVGTYLAYEDYLTQDLRAHITNTYPVRPGPWALGGLSMGGFGSVHLALKHPDLYCSVFAHSSPFFTAEELREYEPQFSAATVADLDCYRLATAVNTDRLPVLSFDCGTDDGLIDSNRRFHTYLETLGIAHSYTEHPGGHTWGYWDLHVQTALRQHARVLGIAPAAATPSAQTSDVAEGTGAA
ncbi:MAG TPA: alpha/beta hydrolase-fold protein [Chloroflexia bacterium]|jgi:S-formylglutathione hydrolase FrmB|nr:alpha/beta hydrolase-fold protein [Chloroflexia bacterium]